MGMKAIFVFRNNEPLASWVAIIAGPLSTLPAVFLALFKRKLAGYWLIVGGLISFVAILLVQTDGDFLSISARVALMILLPMLGLGAVFLLLQKNKESNMPVHSDAPKGGA
jgi:hypothetical protein